MHDLIHRWAVAESISPLAISRLLCMLGIGYEPIQAQGIPQGASETAVSQRVRMAAAAAGILCWRNNVGVAQNPDGQPIRFGLCNDTAALNKKFKSSDLVGVNPLLITPAHVGRTIGQLWLREVKHADWRYTGTEREIAQLNFGQLAISRGADFAFTTGAI